MQSEEVEACICAGEVCKDGYAVMNAPTKSELQERIDALEAELEAVKAEKAKVPNRTKSMLKEIARKADRDMARLAENALKDLQ